MGRRGQRSEGEGNQGDLWGGLLGSFGLELGGSMVCFPIGGW